MMDKIAASMLLHKWTLILLKIPVYIKCRSIIYHILIIKTTSFVMIYHLVIIFLTVCHRIEHYLTLTGSAGALFSRLFLRTSSQAVILIHI